MANENVHALEVGVEQLRFDPDNPRLPQEVEKTQDAILKYLVLSIGVEDIVASMSASGFVDGDPIIATKIDGEDAYYVVEGNRRLAALKLLTGGSAPGGPRIPEMPQEVRDSFGSIPIQTGWRHDELISYLGYKHVTAAKEWGPEAKARFVIKNANGDFSDDALRKFARELGTKLGALKRWLVAYRAVEQARTTGKFDEDLLANRRVFGTFYTLLGSEQVKEFVGLESETVSDAPITKEPEFLEFLGWLVGTKDEAPVINSRDQKDLSRVLANDLSLDYFRSHKDLKAALRYATATKDEVASALRQAAFLIDNIVSEIRSQREDDKVRAAYTQLRKSFKTAELLFGSDDA